MKYIKLNSLLFAMLFITLKACGPGAVEVEETTEVIPVEVFEVRERDIDRRQMFTSTLQPWERQNIAANQPGRITRIHVREGDRVRQGQLLVEMDDAQLQQARLQLENARTNYERMNTLHQAGAIPRQQFEQAEMQFQNAQTQYNLLLQNTRLTAPFSGVITARHMQEGEIFTMAPGAGGAPAILTLQQLNPLEATINLPEMYFPRIRENMPANITSDVYPDREFSGRVSNIHPVIDAGTRTFTVEIRVDNNDEALRPGMFARINLDLGMETGILVPKSAITREPGTQRFYGFVVENGTAVRRTFEPGADLDEWMEITSGLNAGDLLVSTGQGRLRNGDQVEIISHFEENQTQR